MTMGDVVSTIDIIVGAGAVGLGIVAMISLQIRYVRREERNDPESEVNKSEPLTVVSFGP